MVCPEQMEVDEPSESEGVDCSLYGFVGEWRPKLESAYEELVRAGPDVIRSRPTLKGRKTDRDLLQAVDELTRKVLEESRPALEGGEA